MELSRGHGVWNLRRQGFTVGQKAKADIEASK